MFRVIAAIFAAALLASCGSPQPAAQDTAAPIVVYEGARLIPGDGSAAIDASAFIVQRGAIVRVGRKGELTVPPGATRIDLTGKTVMPTLISAHVHPGFQKGLTYSAANYTREMIINDLNFYHSDAEELARAGIDSFAHLVRDKVADDALVASIVKHGVYVMPNMGGAERNTHSTAPGWYTDPHLTALLRETVAAEVIERMRGLFAPRDAAVMKVMHRNYSSIHGSLAKLNAAGARIILGCDTGLPDHFHGYAEQRELELMASAGMPPMQVIVAATSRSAEYLKLADSGALAPGKRADFLVLDANPLDDIRNTRRISRLFIKGTEIDRVALRAAIIK